MIISGDVICHVHSFRYLRSFALKNCGFDEEGKHNIKCGWIKWREASGVLCHKLISMRHKVRYYKSVEKRFMLYVSEY